VTVFRLAGLRKNKQTGVWEYRRVIPKRLRPYHAGRSSSAPRARTTSWMLSAGPCPSLRSLEQQAKVAIEHAHLKARVQLTEIGLHSPEARKFLAALPAVESLMPPLQFERIEQLMLKRVRNRYKYDRAKIGADVEGEQHHRRRLKGV
jgi:hypothetical protein